MRILKAIILTLALTLTTAVRAQEITSVHGTVSDELGGLMGATVCEIDANGRIINSAVTDLNGNFTMKVKSTKDKIRFTYVGMAAQVLPINKTTYNISMKSKTTIKEVVVKSKKRANGNGLPIPEREISYASQTISMKEFEGLGMTTIDEALQGRIAGLDIISNSGDLGAGSTMRLRGIRDFSLGDGQCVALHAFLRLHHDLLDLCGRSHVDVERGLRDRQYLCLHAHVGESYFVARVLHLHGEVTVEVGHGRVDDTSVAVNLAHGGTHQRPHVVAHRSVYRRDGLCTDGRSNHQCQHKYDGFQ